MVVCSEKSLWAQRASGISQKNKSIPNEAAGKFQSFFYCAVSNWKANGSVSVLLCAFVVDSRTGSSGNSKYCNAPLTRPAVRRNHAITAAISSADQVSAVCSSHRRFQHRKFCDRPTYVPAQRSPSSQKWRFFCWRSCALPRITSGRASSRTDGAKKPSISRLRCVKCNNFSCTCCWRETVVKLLVHWSSYSGSLRNVRQNWSVSPKLCPDLS